jgi:hypothetical protein
LSFLSKHFEIFRDAVFEIDLSGVPHYKKKSGVFTLDLLVENMGRTNYGRPHDFLQKKGLWEGPVLLNGKQIEKWDIVPLEFKSKWVKRFKKFYCCRTVLKNSAF